MFKKYIKKFKFELIINYLTPFPNSIYYFATMILQYSQF